MFGIALRIPGSYKNRQGSEGWNERAMTSCSTLYTTCSSVYYIQDRATPPSKNIRVELINILLSRPSIFLAIQAAL